MTVLELEVIKETPQKRITLVRELDKRTIYIKKELKAYNKEVWKTLNELDLQGIPHIYSLKENEVDEIIIAGMGGMLINNLLKANEKVAHTTEKLILQPMQAPEELRMFLYQNGYKILDEHLVREEHRLYEIIVCKYEGLEPQEIDPIYYEIGLKLIENNDPLLNDFIENKIRINQNVLKKLEGKEGQGIEDKRATLNKKIDALNDLLNK